MECTERRVRAWFALQLCLVHLKLLPELRRLVLEWAYTLDVRCWGPNLVVDARGHWGDVKVRFPTGSDWEYDGSWGPRRVNRTVATWLTAYAARAVVLHSRTRRN